MDGRRNRKDFRQLGFDREKGRERHVITSLELDAHRQEDFNKKLQAKYRKIEANEVRFEKYCVRMQII